MVLWRSSCECLSSSGNIVKCECSSSGGECSTKVFIYVELRSAVGSGKGYATRVHVILR